MSCLLAVGVLLSYAGCSMGDESQVMALIKELAPHVIAETRKDDKGVEHVAFVGIRIRENMPKKTRKEVMQLLPHLAKLDHLRELSFNNGISDDDLKTLPPLPTVKKFGTSSTHITDEGLKHLADMKNLKHLRLRRTQVRGPGLAHLKGFSKLEWLELGSTPLDDSAMPHVVANFPRLRRFDFNETNVTPEGLMQLVDLHWLGTIGPPNNIVGPDFTKAKTKAERSRMVR